MSSVEFRNVDVLPGAPVSSWPLEAIQTTLERGGLSDWERLAVAIRADPWGPLARRLEEVLRYSRPYGIAEGMEGLIARTRTRAEKRERDEVAREVGLLVEESRLSRGDFASRIGTSASRLSTYVTGKVTPSAALMVRMRRLARPGGTESPG